MRILGIDPGYATLGYGTIEENRSKLVAIDYGAIITKPTMLMPQRLKFIYDELMTMIAAVKPDVMAIEELFFNTNTKTAITVSQARGVILVAGTNSNLPIYEYTPLQVKQGITGYGRADKNQVQIMVKSLLNLKTVPKPDDTADALAIAICHAHTGNRNQLMEKNQDKFKSL